MDILILNFDQNSYLLKHNVTYLKDCQYDSNHC